MPAILQLSGPVQQGELAPGLCGTLLRWPSQRDVFHHQVGLVAGYAMTQIKKARGLNKKIMNPMDKERKSVLDFCYIQYHQGAISLKKWLEEKGYQQENCGLVNIPHMKDIYGLYHDADGQYAGVVREKTVDTVVLSSIPKNAPQEAILYFNKDGYKKYCKDYRDYWSWVEKRNDARYENTISHGKNYDAKNKTGQRPYYQ